MDWRLSGVSVIELMMQSIRLFWREGIRPIKGMFSMRSGRFKFSAKAWAN